MKTVVVAGLLAAMVAAPALARDPVATVRSREALARIAPRDGGAAIELANAYRVAGRDADANSAYRRALALDNVMLETPTGDAIWSHQVARMALTPQVQLTSR